MIDLNTLRRIAEEGEPADRVEVERSWLRRVLVEMAEGRTALDTLALGEQGMPCCSGQ